MSLALSINFNMAQWRFVSTSYTESPFSSPEAEGSRHLVKPETPRDVGLEMKLLSYLLGPRRVCVCVCVCVHPWTKGFLRPLQSGRGHGSCFPSHANEATGFSRKGMWTHIPVPARRTVFQAVQSDRFAFMVLHATTPKQVSYRCLQPPKFSRASADE